MKYDVHTVMLRSDSVDEVKHVQACEQKGHIKVYFPFPLINM